MAVPSVSSVNDDSFLKRGGRWVVAQSALLVAVVLIAPLFPWEWQHPGTIPVGIALFALGGWVGLAGVRALGRNRTACPQPLADSVLVQSGIYARVRHPLYSSLMFASVGWAVGWASWAGLVAAGALTLLLHAKATREEHWLHERYPAYRDYARRVNRFLPWA